MKTNYGNWISTPMMKTLVAIAAVLYVLTALYAIVYDSVTAPFFILAILAGVATIVVLYMYYCRRVFDFEGGGLMRRIHAYLLDQLPWDGLGRALDVGCGSGALTIATAKRFPLAEVQGIDYWPPMWNYGQAQCESNAAAEGVAERCAFQHGDAAKLDFPDNHFDAVVSNFVFHEVRTQKDKFMLVEEALRVLKKGGAFALHDTFGNRDMYGDMDEFVAYLKEHGIADVSYIPNTERNIEMPPAVRFMLRGVGMLYGTK